ncbi:SDR family NAD(P)-dependent oxidoreductase [Granulosicoccus sp.]|nr:SDR family NAD(P)-dependent oxidoreductase [Granulosicoccus sp.]
MQRFANKRVLITGAAGGIGQCIARTFKHGGAIVAVADRNTDVLDADAHFPGDLTDKHYTDAQKRIQRSRV